MARRAEKEQEEEQEEEEDSVKGDYIDCIPRRSPRVSWHLQ